MSLLARLRALGSRANGAPEPSRRRTSLPPPSPGSLSATPIPAGVEEAGPTGRMRALSSPPVDAGPAETEASAEPRLIVVGGADPLLTGLILAIVVFGVVMVFSASAVFSARTYGSAYHFLIRQGIFALVGLVLMLGLARFDYHRFRPLTYPILAAAVGLLFVVAIGLGKSAGGASRWIQVGPVNIQPSEAAKLAVILWLSYSLSRKQGRMGTFAVGFLPHVLVAGFLMLLCLEQPDFGSAVMIGLLTFVLLFTAGARLRDILGAILLALPFAYLLIATSPYRMRRIEAFLAPFEHRYDIGYQIAESLMSFGAGGTWGVGIGDSHQKLLYLPEAHTDFISAIIGEELGFVGILALVLAMAAVVLLGLRAAIRAPGEYGTYLGVGISCFLGAQAFTNLAVAMGMLPTKGLVLPFISYGGSSLLVNCVAAGILLNVSRARAPALERRAADDLSGGATPKKQRVRSGRTFAQDAISGGAA
ncbi:MAG: putative lipid II flippase FtsW [Myxococcales bacterium]|nr:putative lipid II flippase FtsW [Myxococcales bacterium]